ncbi:hypothetical protein FIV34_09865 [Luteibacter pinisoli]|uniref:Tetratricopeptide repeat protein n=1 Tax=Luteibacter pinisoli TaxID=2589080 RepID=A0A4Y5Z3K2_9GAMM|nr:hypothetical protein [Luteibacter pinisoli]QDE39486.1 hypothetical protein FIV34_09865 [Luteibacter pinisoli]
MMPLLRAAASAGLIAIVGTVASSTAKADDTVTVKQNITLNGESDEAQADMKTVVDAVVQINEGKIQQSIDGPLTDVVTRYEKRYAHSGDVVFSARGMTQGLMYLAEAAVKHSVKGKGSAIDVGPAWSMAYWGRGYGYSEMNRFPEAEVELKKALALSPRDAQYASELAYVYQMEGRFAESLALYETVPGFLDLMDGWGDSEKTEFHCKSLRGQGYDLVELKRLDEAEAAYKACLALMPNEPKSLGELNYIKELRAKGG